LSQAYFYHLTVSPLTVALPQLLEKLFASGQRGVVQMHSAETCEKLDALLWQYKETAFLPHEASEAQQCDCPLVLMLADHNPNKATMRFLLEGVELPDTPYARLCILFDGQDQDELAIARKQWKEAKERGLDCVYFQQDETGRWMKKA
jgi:DNA polymerase III subunit chi